MEVSFAAESGEGSVSQATTITDAQGIAAVGDWTLGKTPGVSRLIVRSKDELGSYAVFRTTGGMQAGAAQTSADVPSLPASPEEPG